MKLVIVVAVVALLEYVYFGYQVGQARTRYEIDAPATTGHPVYERYHRVHQNTLENMVIFLPGLWLFATYVSAPIAAGLGVAFILGRALYARRYVADPASRSTGVMLSFGANMVLLVGGLIGAVIA